MSSQEERNVPERLNVITLCGSMRFWDEFERLSAELTLAGNVVLTPVRLDPAIHPSPEQRERLGRVHLQKVDMSDEVVVVNVGGYLGDSTRAEIDHARARDLRVTFLVDEFEQGAAVTR
jgi:hypothetical protein